jgi:hypothetical protein
MNVAKVKFEQTCIPTVIEGVYCGLRFCLHLVSGVHIPDEMVAYIVTYVHFKQMAVLSKLTGESESQSSSDMEIVRT